MLSSILLQLVTSIFDKLRKKISYWYEPSEPFNGTIEVYESYFGTKQIPDKHGADEFARGNGQINGIEFENFAKRRLA